MTRFPSRSLLLALCWSTSLTTPAQVVAQAVPQETAPAGSLAEAERLDAAGHIAEALPLYRTALEQARDPAVRRRLALRIAIADAMRRPDTLVAFAAGKPAAEVRPIADVLALLGRPKAAFDLAGPGGGVADRLARTQWALAAGDAAGARTAAVQALAAANIPDDKRYALALLVEAYRLGGNLAAVLPVLDAQPQGEAVAAARIDVLLELGRTQPAIAAIERSTSADIRGRLTGVLDLAGDAAASEAEYRRLIAADPHQADLYTRLAAIYLTRGDEAQALATYRALFAANRRRAEVLTAGARAMIAMGLQDQAVAMLAGSAGDPAVATATHLFLFETYLDRGDAAKALAELQAVQRGDTAGLLTEDVADGYERLGRPADALALLRRREAQGRPLGYGGRVRIAQLAEATGDTAEALTRWRALWAETRLPARRSYLERQIVALARRIDQLQPLAQELDARLDAGSLRPGEIDLLVALRLAQDKPDAAADAVRRYAARSGASEAIVLGQLAQLYGRVRDYDLLEATLRRLVVVDPGNRDAHVRQLILTLLRHDDGTAAPAQRQAALDALMAQLSDAGDAGTDAFKATVYAQANLDAPALAALRAAVAAKPGDADALARFATELKRQRRLPEAVALLQAAADRAASTPAFLAAIDALLDTIAGTPPDDGSTAGVLGWTERRVLERIATDGAGARLLGLLSDIAAADADYDLQRRAVEAQVALAGEQRGYVLRELVTLAGGGAADSGGVAIISDPRRKLIYARRLLALGKAFPPDLYADLAGTLLKQGDEPGAERAFAMMSGMGGLVNVDEAKGDAYAAAGRPAQALTNYARALLQDQANFDLLVKTAILYERQGDDAQARRWYWRGLRTLVARQPLAPIGARDERGLDVRRYYPTMVEGLLLNWPGDAAAGQAMRADLDQRFAAEVAALDPAKAGALADHPRLALLVDLGHRIADAQRGDAQLAGWDATLDRVFAQDIAYRRATMLRRHLTGAGDAAVAAGPGWPVAALMVQAEDIANAELRFVLALAGNDSEAVRTELAAALTQEETARKADAHADGETFRDPIYIKLLVDTMDRLPPDRVRAWMLTPLQASPAREDILFDLFRADSDRYLRLQTIAGAPLLTPDALVRLTIEQDNRPLGISLRVSRRAQAGGMDWLDQFSIGQLLALYDGLVTRLARGEGDSLLSDVALTALTRRSMTAAEQQRLSAILDTDIAIVRDRKARSGASLDARLLQWDAAPANRALVFRAARAVADRYPDSALLPIVLERWYAGDKRQAFMALAGLGEALAANGQSTPWLGTAIARHFPDVHRDQIAAFLADPHPDPKTAATVYQRFAVDDPETNAEQRLALTTKMITLDPANSLYGVRLLTLYAEKADWAALAPVLREYVTAHPDDTGAATMLALVDRLLGHDDQAAAVAAAAGVDPDDPDWLVRLLNRARASRANGTSVVALFAPIYEAYLRQNPQRPAVVAVEARQGRTINPAAQGADAALGPLFDAAKGDPTVAPHVLRAMWRESAAISGEGDTGRGRRALVYTFAAAIRGQGTGPAFFALPAISVELQRYSRAMAPEDQAEQIMLYDVAAYGPARSGEGTAQVQAMLATLRAGRSDADDIRRLVALATRTKTVLAPADLDVLDARLLAMPVMSPDSRLVLARLQAHSGRFDVAGALLRAALFQMLYPAGSLDAVEDLSVALDRLVDTLVLWPDAQLQQRIHAQLAQILKMRKLGPGGGDLPPLPPLGGDVPVPAP